MTQARGAQAAPRSLLIDAIVSPWEAAGVRAAALLLKSYLVHEGAVVDVRLRVRDFASSDPPVSGGLAVLSMSCAIGGSEPMAEVSARYAARIAGLRQAGSTTVSLLTVFQHVQGPGAGDRRSRIRRLNLLAAGLSHHTGATVADVDRALSLFGARRMKTDVELGGSLAPEVVAYVLVQAWLSLGLGADVPEPIQASAWEAHGGMSHMTRLERRLAILEGVEVP